MIVCRVIDVSIEGEHRTAGNGLIVLSKNAPECSFLSSVKEITLCFLTDVRNVIEEPPDPKPGTKVQDDGQRRKQRSKAPLGQHSLSQPVTHRYWEEVENMKHLQNQRRLDNPKSLSKDRDEHSVVDKVLKA